MLDRLRARLNKTGAISALELFNAERDLCERLDITDPKMLFSLIRRVKFSGVHLRYPQIQRAGLQRSPKRRKS